MIAIVKRKVRNGAIVALRFGAITLLLAGLQLSASTILLTWTGSGSNSSWATGANWTGCTSNGTPTGTPVTCTNTNIAANLAGNDISFPATFTGSKANPLDSQASLTIDSLTLNPGKVTGLQVGAGAALTISGASSTLGGPPVSISGTLVINNSLTNSGMLTANSTGSISFGGNVNNSLGTISNLGGTITVNGTVNGGTLSGIITNHGAVSGAVSALTVAGTVNGGDVTGTVNAGSGTFDNASFNNVALNGGTLTGASNTLTGTNTLSGTVTNGGTLTETAGTTTINGALNNGIYTVNGGSTDIEGTVGGATGTFNLDSGSVLLNGTLNVSTVNLVGGTFDGTGALNAATLNNGDGTNGSSTEGVLLDVGGSFASGNTTQSADYTVGVYNQDAGGALGIAFNATVTGNDMLIADDVSLNGSLDLWNSTGGEMNLNLLNHSLSYELVDALDQPVIGQFATINALNLAGTSFSNPGLGPGWWLVYNGHLSTAGTGDVELDFVNATAPEPATDFLIGGAIFGLALFRKRLRRN